MLLAARRANPARRSTPLAHALSARRSLRPSDPYCTKRPRSLAVMLRRAICKDRESKGKTPLERSRKLQTRRRPSMIVGHALPAAIRSPLRSPADIDACQIRKFVYSVVEGLAPARFGPVERNIDLPGASRLNPRLNDRISHRGEVSRPAGRPRMPTRLEFEPQSSASTTALRWPAGRLLVLSVI